MASAPKRTVPEAFPDELRFFTREVLRAYASTEAADSKEWALQYAVDYFSNGGKDALLAQRAAASAAVEDGSAFPAFPTAEELEAKIEEIFIAADRDGNGVLDRKEFKKVMKLFAKELGIKMGDLRALMAAADENADGLIEYHEFVPLAIELLQTIYAKQRAAAEAASRAAEAAEASQAFLLYGMSQEELEATMSEVFLRADTDGSGFLDRKEFAAALRDAELGFTKKQISLLQNEADEDGDGRISYREFIPVCFGLLTEMVAKSLELNLVPQEEVALAEYLQALMAEYDVDGSGKVPLGVANAAFRDSDLGLSRLQTRALLAEANSCIDADGLVDYAAFSKVAASFINSIIGVQMDSDKAARIVAQRASGGLASVGGFDRGAFRDRLQGAFAAIDPSGSGRAHIADVRTVLREDLQFDDKQSAAIINLAREAGLAEDGSVDLAYVVEYAFDVLIQLMEVEMMHAGGF